uniref:Poly [ADP-ribose] polymerase n=1 Tax=Panagrolaimus superbus TaxID=310955 RepID=A0A914XV90_9BILA
MKFLILFFRKRKSLGDGAATFIPEKKLKIDPTETELLNKLKRQTNTVSKIRKDLTARLLDDDAVDFLKINNRYFCKSLRANIEILTDCIVFGVPEKCKICPRGTLSYCSIQHTYKCSGKLTPYSSCPHHDRNPPRVDLRVPQSLKKNVFKFFLPKRAILNIRYYPKSFDITPPACSSPLVNKLKNRRSSFPECDKKALSKDGCIIDGRCEFSKFVHVFIDTDGTLYQIFMGLTDINRNVNSFCKLQLLKHNKKDEYFVYEGRGRMGSAGTYQTYYFEEDLCGAKMEFERIFLDVSKNHWEDRQNFVKNPFGYDILEMEVAENKLQSFDVSTSKSNLPIPIKSLITNIFDIKIMKETLKSLDIDTEKMPLGKISKTSILKAMYVLSRLEFEIGKDAQSTEILDLSNRFYTLFPHGCGGNAPPLLNNLQIIHEKVKLLNDLSQLEIAFSIIHDETFEDDMDADPIDKYYEKLHCKISVLSSDSKEFKIIESYLTKNQASKDFIDYNLEILDIFKIQRDNEESRFNLQIGNRHLLWHGSRISNFAGILSKGLKIAPPEAPANGYMFGKGIYFADMVSKSAQYCDSLRDDQGYLLLCEVALGKIERKRNHDSRIKKPKNGKSSIKGLGQIVPEKCDFSTLIEDGITVPIGKAINLGSKNYSLIYNEYIVYDEAQVKMKYLVRAKFNKNN